MKVPKWQALLTLMSDYQWHSMRELAAVAGWRYGGRLYDIKQQGYDHEIEVRANDERYYRLVRRVPSGMQMSLLQEATR